MSTEGTQPMNATKHKDTVIDAPELEPLDLSDKPDGPGAAMMISAGIGMFVLGVLTVLAEASTSAKTWLETWQWGQGVGPLAGKTTIATLVSVLSLVVLWAIWRKKDINIKMAFYIGLTLGILGALGTFPTFYQMFTVS
jgi:fluoride ion exporter CrcB/FEX